VQKFDPSHPGIGHPRLKIKRAAQQPHRLRHATVRLGCGGRPHRTPERPVDVPGVPIVVRQAHRVINLHPAGRVSRGGEARVHRAALIGQHLLHQELGQQRVREPVPSHAIVAKHTRVERLTQQRQNGIPETNRGRHLSDPAGAVRPPADGQDGSEPTGRCGQPVPSAGQRVA
jgi:hypothetical protein